MRFAPNDSSYEIKVRQGFLWFWFCKHKANLFSFTPERTSNHTMFSNRKPLVVCRTKVAAEKGFDKYGVVLEYCFYYGKLQCKIKSTLMYEQSNFECLEYDLGTFF